MGAGDGMELERVTRTGFIVGCFHLSHWHRL